MNQSVIENLKKRLNRRANQVRESHYSTLAPQVEIFCQFIENEFILKDILNDLRKTYGHNQEIYSVIRQNSPAVNLFTYQPDQVGFKIKLEHKNNKYLAALAYSFLKGFLTDWKSNSTHETDRIMVVSYAPRRKENPSMQEIINFFCSI